MSDTPGNVCGYVDKMHHSIHRCDLVDSPCQDSESTGVDNRCPHAPAKDTLWVWATCTTIEATPEDAPTSNRGLTKSAPVPAKTRGVSMAGPQHKTDPRPGIKSDDKHGTTTGYRYGCRLDCCRRAVADAAASRRKRQYLQRTDELSVPSRGTQRRIQALVSLGWSMARLSQEAGYDRSHANLILDRGVLRASTARRFADVYERLSMTLPPTVTKVQKIDATRSRNLAKRNGWAPPLAWDDIDHDAEPVRPASTRDIDEVKIRRVLDGIRQDCNAAERVAVVAAWTGSQAELQRLTGWNVNRMLRERDAA